MTADNYDKGAAGERAVASILDELGGGEFVVLHDLSIPGSKANVDHLVIGPTGVFMVDAKCWQVKLKAGDGTLWRGRKPIRQECAKASWEAQQMANVVGCAVQPVICFVDTTLPEPVQQCDDVVVCQADAVQMVIRLAPRMLEPDAVAKAVAAFAPLVRSGRPPVFGAGEADSTTTTIIPVTAGGVAPRAKRIPGRFSARPVVFRLLSPVLGLALLVGAWSQVGRVSTWFSNTMADDTSNAADAGTTTTSSAAPTSALAAAVSDALAPTTLVPSALASSTPTTAPFLPPVIDFSCPTHGGGWVATPMPSEFRSDPDGFNIWYADALGGWTYWGSFKSGISVPSPLAAVRSGTVLKLRLGRGLSLNPATASMTMEAPAPTEPC